MIIAKDLKIGDKITTAEGKEVTIKSISKGWFSRPSLFLEWNGGWACVLMNDEVGDDKRSEEA